MPRKKQREVEDALLKEEEELGMATEAAGEEEYVEYEEAIEEEPAYEEVV